MSWVMHMSSFEQYVQSIYHRQSKEWTGNAGKIANVADATSVMRPDTPYFGTLYLHFKNISRLCIYKFY